MVQSWAIDSQKIGTLRIGSQNTASAAVRGNPASTRSTAAKKKASMGIRTARLLFFAAAFTILFSGLTLMRTFASEDHVQPVTGAEKSISADSGDTLWSLAASVKKDSMDNREAVHLLMKRNGLASSSLMNGQVLIVPEEILP